MYLQPLKKTGDFIDEHSGGPLLFALSGNDATYPEHVKLQLPALLERFETATPDFIDEHSGGLRLVEVVTCVRDNAAEPASTRCGRRPRRGV
jgi:hypothetical protein